MACDEAWLLLVIGHANLCIDVLLVVSVQKRESCPGSLDVTHRTESGYTNVATAGTVNDCSDSRDGILMRIEYSILLRKPVLALSIS